jgi:hypothetical protein
MRLYIVRMKAAGSLSEALSANPSVGTCGLGVATIKW